MRRLMIVDDDTGMTESFKRAFGDQYEVIAANCGEEAMEIVKELAPELVVLDWRLKGVVEGEDVLLFLKRECPQIIVYVFTASAQDEKKIRSLGADDFLLKPCFDLKQRINDALPP